MKPLLVLLGEVRLRKEDLQRHPAIKLCVLCLIDNREAADPDDTRGSVLVLKDPSKELSFWGLLTLSILKLLDLATPWC
jgi:hypothetical protein